ncbi:Kelch-like protein 20 [Nymphon striatum]|nr:Kelch-like protein 20 [Nymphon striatum]
MKKLIKFSLLLFITSLLSCKETKTTEIIYQNSDGLRTIDTKEPLTLDSQFRLASVSKQFTGMSIMKLKEAGKIDYDQTVKSILPRFPYDSITVRHLLHHVSGLTDYERLLDENWKAKDSTKTYILGNDEIIEVFYDVNPKLDFESGERWEYSNTGYLFLASIVEKISGKHFRDYLNETIFEPLGMNNTVLYKYRLDADPNMPNRVFGYEVALNQVDLVKNDYNIVNDVRGDGGIYSTLEDLYKWNQALVNHTIIPKTFLDEAWTPGVLNNGEPTTYGFGWGIQSKEGESKIVSHSGGWVGFVTFLHNEVDANNGFVLLTNDSGQNFRGTIKGLFNIMEGKPYELPKYQIEKEMAKKIMAEDIEKGISMYHELKKDTVQYSTSEGRMNMLGYGLLQNDNLEGALGVFKLNIEEYPKSANTYDSYGDALLAKGDSIEALKNFRRSFELDSTLDLSNEKALKLEAVFDLKE